MTIQDHSTGLKGPPDTFENKNKNAISPFPTRFVLQTCKNQSLFGEGLKRPPDTFEYKNKNE